MASEEKNALVSQSIQQVDSYYVRGDEFVVGGKGSDVVVTSKPHGWAEGHNELVEAACDNAALESDGDMTPSVWGKGGKAFPVETNRGEGNGPASSMTYMGGVDCVTGMTTGGDPSPVGEVTDMNVHIPAGRGKASPGTGNKPVGSASVGAGVTKTSGNYSNRGN